MSVTARGGYQIVDFNNVVITNSGYVSIPGISKKMLNLDKKPLCIAGLILHKSDMNPDSNISIPCQYIEPIYAEEPMPNYQFSVKANGTIFTLSVVTEGDAVFMQAESDNT